MTDSSQSGSGNSSDEAESATSERLLVSNWEPHPGQQAVMEIDARFRILACGRRWGKSTLCAHLAVERALEGPGSTVWWVAPTYEQANEWGFENIKPLLPSGLLAREPRREEPRKIWLENGSVLSFRSADRADALRGGGVDFLVIDEAAAIPERAWTKELRPTLSDTLGDMVAISTPRGRGWFYRWFQRGQSDDHPAVASWRGPTAQNPAVSEGEIESARIDVSEIEFQQEYEARFVLGANTVFDEIRDRAVKSYSLPVAPDKSASPYQIGVDFARHDDWTVVAVLDGNNRLVAFDRRQKTSWGNIQGVIQRLADQYWPNRIAVDGTRDSKIAEDLEYQGYHVGPVKLTAGKKRILVKNLKVTIESRELAIPESETTLIGELEQYEVEMTETGRPHYYAPTSGHDDCVDALALAVSAAPPKRRKVPEVYGSKRRSRKKFRVLTRRD